MHLFFLVDITVIVYSFIGVPLFCSLCIISTCNVVFCYGLLLLLSKNKIESPPPWVPLTDPDLSVGSLCVVIIVEVVTVLERCY